MNTTKQKKASKKLAANQSLSPIRQKLSKIGAFGLSNWPVLTTEQAKSHPFSPTDPKDRYSYLARADLMVVSEEEIESLKSEGWYGRVCKSSVYGEYTLLERFSI